MTNGELGRRGGHCEGRENSEARLCLIEAVEIY